MAREGGKRRDGLSIDELLEELDQLRELDQQRHAPAPGSRTHDPAATYLHLARAFAAHTIGVTRTG